MYSYHHPTWKSYLFLWHGSIGTLKLSSVFCYDANDSKMGSQRFASAILMLFIAPMLLYPYFVWPIWFIRHFNLFSPPSVVHSQYAAMGIASLANTTAITLNHQSKFKQPNDLCMHHIELNDYIS